MVPPPPTPEGAARKKSFLENELQYSSNNPWKNHCDIINRFRDISFGQIFSFLIQCAGAIRAGCAILYLADDTKIKKINNVYVEVN